MFGTNSAAPRYSFKTRLGNWHEDQVLAEARQADFQSRKNNGQLLVHSVEKMRNVTLKPAGVSASTDGQLRFGDHVMLFNVQTDGVLSVDPADKLTSSYNDAYAATTSTQIKGAVARNVFVIEPFEQKEVQGDVLHFGQAFRLRANPLLFQEAVYLSSVAVSPLCSSKYSRHQEVSFCKTAAYDTAWKVHSKDTATRFEMNGKPASANIEVVITHAKTGQALAADKVQYINDYGTEWEVCGHTFAPVGKREAMMAEWKGTQTADMPYKTEFPQNHWAFLTATTEEQVALLAAQAQSSTAVDSAAVSVHPPGQVNAFAK